MIDTSAWQHKNNNVSTSTDMLHQNTVPCNFNEAQQYHNQHVADIHSVYDLDAPSWHLVTELCHGRNWTSCVMGIVTRQMRR